MWKLLSKPIYIPGFRPKIRKPKEPLTLRATLAIMGLMLAINSALLASIYVTTYLVVGLWTITTESPPRSIDELPFWVPFVCIPVPPLVLIGIAWRLRFLEKFARLLKKERERDGQA